MKNNHAQELGRLGGKSKSAAKSAAARSNGAKGGRPISITVNGGEYRIPAATAAEIKCSFFEGPSGEYGFRNGDWPFEFRGQKYKVFASIPHAASIDDQEDSLRKSAIGELIRQNVLPDPN